MIHTLLMRNKFVGAKIQTIEQKKPNTVLRITTLSLVRILGNKVIIHLINTAQPSNEPINWRMLKTNTVYCIYHQSGNHTLFPVS